MTAPRSGGVTLRAHAKVNPMLSVVGRRADGFHELETVLLALELADEVTVRSGNGQAEPVTVTTTGPLATADIVDGPRHLAARGAALAREILGAPEQLQVEVVKHVPSRAGLGGGSSDAAAAAAATIELLGPEDAVERAALHARCADGLGAIGSDCAFFGRATETGFAHGGGRGDELTPLRPAPAWELLIVTPEDTCSTPAVYGALQDAERRGDLVGAAAFAGLGDLSASEARARLVNDLEPAARRAAPGLDAWRALFGRARLDHMLLAGSGSSFFGLFEPDTGEADEARGRVLAAASAAGLSSRLCLVTRPAGTTWTQAPSR